jgi:Zn-dependent membrane protease YugP
MTIWILSIGTMAISLFAAARVKSVYNQHNRGTVASAVTGGEAAVLILRHAGIRDVEIGVQDEILGDHYDPVNKRLVLSSTNYHGSTPAALGVAAHECGHAIQHQTSSA